MYAPSRAGKVVAMAIPVVQRGSLVPHRARLHARAHVIFRGTPGVLTIVLERAGGEHVGAVPASDTDLTEDGELTVATIEGDVDATLEPGAYRICLVADPARDVTVRSLDYVLLAAWD